MQRSKQEDIGMYVLLVSIRMIGVIVTGMCPTANVSLYTVHTIPYNVCDTRTLTYSVLVVAVIIFSHPSQLSQRKFHPILQHARCGNNLAMLDTTTAAVALRVQYRYEQVKHVLLY